MFRQSDNPVINGSRYGTGQSSGYQQALAQMLMRGAGSAPRNVGEGLYSLGSSLASAMMMNRHEKERQAAQDAFFRDLYGADTPNATQGANAGGEPVAASGGGYNPYAGLTPQQRAGLGMLAQTQGVNSAQQALAQVLLDEPPKEDLPASVDEYNFAISQGFEGSFLDFERAKADATRAPQQPRQPTDYDRKLAYYGALPGVSAEQAQGLALDRYTISRDPISRQAQVVDRVTGEIVGGNIQAVPPGPSGPMAQGGGASMAGGPGVASQAAPAPDPRAATGLSGFWGNLANWASDLAGFGVPFPNVDEAGRALAELKADVITVGSAEVPGRPSDFARQLEGINTVDPFSLFETPERSVGKLRQTRQSLAGEIARMEGLLANSGLYTPQQVATTRQNLERMRGLHDRVDVLLAAANRGGEQPGGNPEIDGIVNKYLGAGVP